MEKYIKNLKENVVNNKSLEEFRQIIQKTEILK
jgi:hypothetical protein